MNQIIRIFLKDARCFRIEIGVFMLLAAIFAWIGGRVAGSEILLEAGAIYLIARVVHADPIPGDRQFWLTRPYHRMSLAGAKLLFIAAFVCAPICAAQIAMLLATGFPLPASIPGLLWSQALLFFAGSLLIAALASTTSNTVILMLSFLVLGAFAMIGEVLYSGPVANATYLRQGSSASGWIRQYSALAILVLTAAFVLFRQYRDRATTFSRIAGTAGLALAAGLFLWLPTSAVLAAQLWFSRPPAGKSLDISIDPSLKGRGVWVSGGRDPLYRLWRIPLPMTIKDLPDGMEARVEALSISFAWPENHTWTPSIAPGLNPRPGTPGVSVADATILMDSDLYRANRNSPLTLTGAAYITLFGGSQTRTATLGDGPVNFQDGLQCTLAEFNFLVCRSFFRWPARLVYAEAAGARYDFRNSQVSYSPFPASVSLNSMEQRFGGELKSHELTLITKKPLAHFWQQFHVTGLRLADFEGPEPPIRR